MKKLMAVTILTLAASPAWAAFWQIGDNDGYGIGIADNANHPFDGFNAGHDGRSAGEMAATDGAQYTDTYSTNHGSFSPSDQTGDLTTFSFTGLGSGWTEGSMWFDMADFQASTFGAVATTYNGIAQDWAFNDGFPTTLVRFFNLSPAVIASINVSGVLDVVIDRQDSSDFYGFDYALLSDRQGDDGNPIDMPVIPVPAAIWLFGTALIGFVGMSRRRKVA